MAAAIRNADGNVSLTCPVQPVFTGSMSFRLDCRWRAQTRVVSRRSVTACRWIAYRRYLNPLIKRTRFGVPGGAE